MRLFPEPVQTAAFLSYFLRIAVDLYKRQGEIFLYKSAESFQCLRFGEISNPAQGLLFDLPVISNLQNLPLTSSR